MEQPSPQHRMRFHGSGGEYFGIWIVNLVLSFITLGIYSAWAKVRNKQYFYGNTELAGERFEYLATPKQILIGRIITFIAFGIWLWSQAFSPEFSLVLMLAFFIILPVIVVRNLRFNARVSRYRNVRFDFTGRYRAAYLNLFAKPLAVFLAIVATMGISMIAGEGSALAEGIGSLLAFLVIAPLGYAWLFKNAAEFIINHYRWGEHSFAASVNTRYYVKVMAMAALFFVLAIVVIGIIIAVLAGVIAASDFAYRFGELMEGDIVGAGIGIFGFIILFYLGLFALGMIFQAFIRVKLRNYHFNQTTLAGNIQLKSELTVLTYIGVTLTNLLMVVCTFGFAMPWAKVRMSKMLADATSLQGELDTLHSQNLQSQQGSAIADELADGFDIEIGVI